jgi:polar amino acid transport system permease protein
VEAFRYILDGLPTTLALTVVSMAVGAVAALPLMLARRSSSVVIRTIARLFIDVLRGVPPLVWLFIIFFGLGQEGISLSPFNAAGLGLAAISAAYLAEIYRGGLMAVDKGQHEAGQALGLPRRSVFASVIAPQAFRVALPAIATYGIGLLKDTAIAYTIGVNEVLFRANHEAQSGAVSPMAALAFAGGLYVVFSVAAAFASRRLDGRLRAKVAR